MPHDGMLCHRPSTNSASDAITPKACQQSNYPHKYKCMKDIRAYGAKQESLILDLLIIYAYFILSPRTFDLKATLLLFTGIDMLKRPRHMGLNQLRLACQHFLRYHCTQNPFLELFYLLPAPQVIQTGHDIVMYPAEGEFRLHLQNKFSH
jgi:hypothetical protein